MPMRWLGCLAVVSCLALFAAPAPEARAQKKEVKLTRQWKGSVKDEDLRKGAPEVITSAKALKHLWGTWQVSDKLPEVDFKKEIVLVVTGGGSRLNALARLDDAGNLEVLGMGTLDLVPGFRYVIATVPREGVKTVNKKPLPGE
jgi:hypothetical protein